MSDRYAPHLLKQCLYAAAAFALYVSCKQEFIGTNIPKPSKKETVSPQEAPQPRGRTAATPPPFIGGSGGQIGNGSRPGPDITEPGTIVIEVVQSSSESWWRHCLLARAMYSPEWVRVSCNKGEGSETRSVRLPGIRGTCNAISIAIETYRNIGNECSRRLQQGRPCEGPYPSVPDRVVVPEPDSGMTSSSKTSAFSIYNSWNTNRPDPMIQANEDWTLPSFETLGEEMKQWLSLKPSNRWYRAFFEDQSPEKIRQARSNPQNAKQLGVDYNDYVFDIKSEGIEVGISGSGLSCP